MVRLQMFHEFKTTEVALYKSIADMLLGNVYKKKQQEKKASNACLWGYLISNTFFFFLLPHAVWSSSRRDTVT